MQIGEPPQSGFNDPLGLLSDCHRRIERFLGGLLRVARDLQGAALDDRYRHALQVSLDYFQESGPRHTEDEEASLFPRMRAAGGEAAGVLERMARLEEEHRESDRLHHEVDLLGRRWLSEGTLPAPEASRFQEMLERLEAIYGEHIRIEDEEVFPCASRALPPSELDAVGREMARRRGLYPSDLPWLNE